jgi:general secretion pathway protein A
MVLDYYNLSDQPFGVTPDTRYLYLGATHREALASLFQGVQTGRGFMSLIARPGLGKTTILFRLLQHLEGYARTVFLFQTLCGPEDLLRSLLRDLGMEANHSDLAGMHAQLNEHLLMQSRQGRRLVVVIDEAQNLPDSALELIRMLSNFENPREKLMQIVLAGQPQLADKLMSPSLVQLRQRISIIARLKPFTSEEARFYVGHRLQVAGYDLQTPLFTARAGALLAQHSEGIPRNINNICFNALSIGCALKRKPIDEEVILEVIDDLDFGSAAERETIVLEPRESVLKISTVADRKGMKANGRFWLSGRAAAVMLFLTLPWLLGAGERNTRLHRSQISAAEESTPSRTALSSSAISPMSSSTPSAQVPNTETTSLAPTSAALAAHPNEATVTTNPRPGARPIKIGTQARPESHANTIGPNGGSQ